MPLVSHACSERAPLSWRCITNEVWVGAASSRMMRCGTVTTAINSTVHATSTTTAAAGRQTAAALPPDIPPLRPPPRLFTLLSLPHFREKKHRSYFEQGRARRWSSFTSSSPRGAGARVCCGARVHARRCCSTCSGRTVSSPRAGGAVPTAFSPSRGCI